ncbi:MAG: aa3-type cytochrome c oxidase subunit IV [Devosia sp.]
MAKKPSTTADEIPPAMDYAQHEGTYRGFLRMTKYTMVALLLLVLALYCFIEAGQPIIGTLLLLAIPVGAVGLVVMGSRR